MKTAEKTKWTLVGDIGQFPENCGMGVKLDGKQYAVFNFTSLGKWYATQNMCPHKKEMALARGLIGNAGDIPKVACAMHKNSFSLETGKCINNESLEPIEVFPVKVENNKIFIGLPD